MDALAKVSFFNGSCEAVLGVDGWKCPGNASVEKLLNLMGQLPLKVGYAPNEHLARAQEAADALRGKVTYYAKVASKEGTIY